MKDRISRHPGRVRLTPVNGQVNTFDLTREDDPEEAGTPLNKSTLLQDSTAQALGLEQDDPTVDDAFRKIADDFKDFWWLGKSSVTLYLTHLSETVDILGSNIGTFTVSSGNDSVVTAEIIGSSVVLLGVSKGSTTVTVTNQETMTSREISLTVSQDIPDKILNNNTPDMIRFAAMAGVAPDFWSVGDTVDIKFDGLVTVGSIQINGTYTAVIIGFNHNREFEGDNTIHFTMPILNGVWPAAFVDDDSLYNKAGNTAAFRMNLSATNAGGWESSYMRGTVCAQFYQALPITWRNVIAASPKYTDNVGGGGFAAQNVTETRDRVWIHSFYEIQGVTSLNDANANPAEANYQMQYYDYFVTLFDYDNRKYSYKYDGTGYMKAVEYWTRSCNSDAVGFCVPGGSQPDYGKASDYALGFAPCFSVA